MESKMTLSPAQLGRGMKQRAGLRIVALSVLLTGLMAAGLFMGLGGGQAQSGGQAPDYEQVDDFLDGATHLLRNDDLVMTFSYTSGQPRSALFTAGTTDSSPTFLSLNQPTVPNGQAGCASSGGCNLDYLERNDQLATGRFFNTVRDTTVLYPLQIDGNQAPLLVSLAGRTTAGAPPAAGLTWVSAQEINLGFGLVYAPAVGDFNGDGYDDLLMAYSNKLRIATAVDANDPSKGFKFGPEFTHTYIAVRELAVGNFDADRLPEVALLAGDQRARLTVATYQVDPANLAISAGGSAILLPSQPGLLTATAGNFTAAINQQLAVGFTADGGGKVQIIDFDPQSAQPKLMTTWEAAGDIGIWKLKAGRFNWASPYDQIAWMSSTNLFQTRLRILTVDPANLTIKETASYLFDRDQGNFRGQDIAIGNFDHTQPNAADPTQKERNPNLQIAMIGLRVDRQNRENGAGVAILDVAADLSTITTSSYATLDQAYFGGNVPSEVTIAAADLQGRSLRLGAGYKVTVDRTQPSVVLAAPPMHADYVSPANDQLPTVLNLSVAPDGFKSKYTQTESSDASVTSTATTSSSLAVEESFDASFALGQFNSGGELENGVKVNVAGKAQQDFKNSSETSNGAFNSAEFEISQETGLSDVVWFKDTSYYLYVYPVIGRKACPADKPNCQESEKQPLQVMFSAPKETTVQRLASDTIEWYQPPWEYGNILSYPAGLAQLKQYLPDIALLTRELTVFATDDASAELKTTWANGRTSGQTVEHEELFSEELDVSVEVKISGKVPIINTGGSASAEVGVNLSGSKATKSLSTSETQLKSAQGITITKSAFFTNPFSYKYFFSPYIFGKVQPVGFSDPVSSTADLLAYGALRSAYTVDPLANGVGGWWSQSPYRQLPDVALNHPNLWDYSSRIKPANGVIPSNCVSINTTTMNCVTPAEREPDNPWLDPFHDMRSLFITNASNPPSANALMAPGSQLETATVGDKLMLWARIYNYSFKAMPVGARVKVRFYAMELNEQNRPVNGDGGSFLIGEDVLAPIAPFDTGATAPINWVLARTSFDTTPYEDKALAFWVAVWIEDANGQQVQEVTGHGLTGIPENTDRPAFAEITELEELVDNPLKMAADDPAQVSFSNNIGFYRSAFHILPKTSAPTTTAVAAVSGAAEIKIEKIETASTALKPGQSVEASVTLRGGAQELLGVTIYFYDGDPAAGGQLVDVERVARLRANGQQKVSIRFRPQICGAHQVFVRVAPGKEHTVTGQAAQAVQVECPTPVCVAQVCLRSASYYALNLNRLPQGMVTVIGGGLNKQLSTSNTTRLRLLLQGGVSRQQQLNQQFVATQLSLLAQAGGQQTALQSNLLCYQVNFQPTRLSTGVTLNPAMTLGELFEQVRQAGHSGNALDQRLLTNLLQLLNSNDPQGRCR